MAPKHSLKEAYQLFFQNLFNFEGRTRRSDFWPIIILNSFISSLVSSIISAIFNAALGEGNFVGSTIGSVISIGVFVLQLGIIVRRLHDTGKEWTYYLLALIPLVGWIIVFIAFLKDSEPGTNKFGPNPKEMATGAAPFNPGYVPQQPNFNAPAGYAQQPVQQPYANPAAPVATPVAPVAPAEPTFTQPAPQAPTAPTDNQYASGFSAAYPQTPAPAAPAEPAAPAAPAAAAYCTNCGAPIPSGSTVCPACGNTIG